jgi:transposase
MFVLPLGPYRYLFPMSEPLCPGCRDRDAVIADLQRQVAELVARVRDLEARLGTNASNSSLPPSANPPQAPPPVRKRKSPRRPGGQPGHPPHLKQLLPPERVTTVRAFVPDRCERCAAQLPAQAGPDDPEPTRFQVVELPPMAAVVTEYQGQTRTCLACGHTTRASIPPDLKAHVVGPRFSATLSYLTGCHGLSKRGVEEIAAAIFDAPVSLGTVANLEREMSAAVAAAHQEAVAAVRAAAIKGADETSWKQAGRLCWLWAAAAAGVAAFVIHAGRGLLGLAALLGEEVQGILCSDRWHVYNQVPAARRQICWAHLKRDFQKIIDRSGPAAAVGRKGKALVKKVFAAWHRFQEGDYTRDQLQAALAPIERRMSRVLIEGFCGEDPSVEAFCDNLLRIEAALWTFAKTPGIEPTNNLLERLLRRAVLWRKRSFGSWSVSGCRFVERILTVVQTRRLQNQRVLSYLHEALVAHRTGQPCPKLLPQG